MKKEPKNIKSLDYNVVYKSAVEILNDSDFDCRFRIEKQSKLGELQKSYLMELLIIGAKPYIEVYFNNADKKFLPFYGYNELTALLDFVENEYKLFRVETLPELSGKSFNELPYVMKATLDKPIIKCILFEKLSVDDLKHMNKTLNNMD